MINEWSAATNKWTCCSNQCCCISLLKSSPVKIICWSLWGVSASSLSEVFDSAFAFIFSAETNLDNSSLFLNSLLWYCRKVLPGQRFFGFPNDKVFARKLSSSAENVYQLQDLTLNFSLISVMVIRSESKWVCHFFDRKTPFLMSSTPSPAFRHADLNNSSQSPLLSLQNL